MKTIKHVKTITEQKKAFFKTLVSIAVLLGGIYAYLSMRDELHETLQYLREMRWECLLLLVPTIILMYYAAGGIWYPYMRQWGLSTGELGKIQYELNFVNTVVPFLKVLTGLFYAQRRLKVYGVSETEASILYTFRYYISIATKWIEIAIAMIVLTLIGKTGEMPAWTVWVTCVLAVGILGGLAGVIVLFRKKARVPKKALESRKFGKMARGVDERLEEVFRILDHASEHKEALFESLAWGMIYSLLEVLPFWIVAMAMGHPELLLQIIVASGIGITVGVFTPTPMGIGGFDGAMIFFMGSVESNAALAIAITITAHVITVVGTAVTGIPFWLGGMRQIGTEE